MICKRSVAILALALTLALLPAGMVQAKEPLECEINIVLDLPNLKWYGTISGDIDGTFIITADPLPSFPGGTEHFLETWVITPNGEGEIYLHQEGVWNFKTGRWRSNGMVTAASNDYTYLIGCNVHVRGVTETPIHDKMEGEGTLLMSSFRQIHEM